MIVPFPSISASLLQVPSPKRPGLRPAARRGRLWATLFVGVWLATTGGCDVGSTTVKNDPPPSNHAPGPQKTPRFLFVLGANQVQSYMIDATSGVLSTTAQGTWTVPVTDGHIAVDPLGRFLYVSDTDSYAIYTYKIDGVTGTLTDGSPLSTSLIYEPFDMAVDPTGRFLYVGDNNSVIAYALDQTQGGPVTLLGTYISSHPSRLRIVPDGRKLYGQQPNGSTTDIVEYSILSNGTLVSFGLPVINLPGTPGDAMAMHPSGTHLYVNSRSLPTISRIYVPINGVATFGRPAMPSCMAIDGNGKYLYTTVQSSHIYAFTIAPASGTIALSSTYTVGVGSVALVAEPMGKYVYILDGTGALYSAVIQIGGSLAPTLPTSSYVTGGYELAVVSY